MEHETLLSLLRDPAHWEFEIILTLIQDVVIGLLVWPFVSKHWKHHVERDEEAGLDRNKRRRKLKKETAWLGGFEGPQNKRPVGPPPKGKLSGVVTAKGSSSHGGK